MAGETLTGWPDPMGPPRARAVSSVSLEGPSSLTAAAALDSLVGQISGASWGLLPCPRGRELRPREEEGQGTPASALILDTLCPDPGALRLSGSPAPWLQAVVEIVPQPEPLTRVTSTWPRARHGTVTDAQEKYDSGGE